jgi:hypothetical protein
LVENRAITPTSKENGMTIHIGITLDATTREDQRQLMQNWPKPMDFIDSLNARLSEVFNSNGDPVEVEVTHSVYDGVNIDVRKDITARVVEVMVLPLDPESSHEVQLDHVADVGKCIRDLKAARVMYDGLSDQEWLACINAGFGDLDVWA